MSPRFRGWVGYRTIQIKVIASITKMACLKLEKYELYEVFISENLCNLGHVMVLVPDFI